MLLFPLLNVRLSASRCCYFHCKMLDCQCLNADNLTNKLRNWYVSHVGNVLLYEGHPIKNETFSIAQ